MVTRKMILGMILFTLLYVGIANGTTYYIDPNGSDDANGLTPETAFATIQKGIDTASTGDTVIAAEGEYTGNGNRNIDFSGNAITVQSTDPNDPCVVAATVINCEGSRGSPRCGFIFENSEDCNSVLDGLTITDGYGSYIGFDNIYAGGAILCDGSSPTIRRCIFKNNMNDKTNNNTYGGAIACYVNADPLIENCIIYDNEAYYGGGISALGSDPNIRSCMIWGNNATSGGGVDISGSPNININNCTIVDNSADTGGGIASTSAIDAATNCILWNNGDDLYNCSATYSCIEDSFDVNDPNYLGSINSDPCFADADANDFHLSQTSPCINAGDPNGIYTGQTDIDGEYREMGGRVDMGADENGPVGWWKLDEGSGSVIIDCSHNSNDGNLLGDTTWASGVARKALIFDGNDDYAQIGSTNDEPLIPEGSKFTISAWVYLTDLNDYKTIYGYCSSYSYIYWAYCMAIHDGDFRLWIGNGTTVQCLQNLDGGNDLSPNKWYHLAVVFDGNDVHGYINGEYKNTVAVTLSGTFPKAGLGTKYELIGGAYNGTVLEFAGKIDDVRVWQRVLTSSEVQNIFYDGMINVKEPPYNATGDGSTDDSNSIQQAIDDANNEDNFILLEDGTFLVNNGIDLDGGMTLYGRDATLKNKNMDSRDLWSDPLLDVSSNCCVKDLIVDGNDRRLVGIKISNEHDVTIENCTVQNFFSSNGYVLGVAIIAYTQDCNNIEINSCTVKDMNSTIGTSCRAIYVKSYEGDTIYNTDINDCTFDNIRCGNAYYDGDAIHVITTNPNPFNDPNDPNECYWQPCYITIQNCEFSNYSKRGVKLQCSNAIVQDCTFTNVNPDYATPIAIGTFGSSTISGNDINDPNLHAGIAAIFSKDCTFEDNEIVIHKEDICYGIKLADTNNVTVTNNQITAYYGLRLTDEGDGTPPVNNTFNFNTLDVIDIVYRNVPDPNNDNNNTTAPNTFVEWSSTIAYSVDDVVTHNGNDYKCNTAHTNQEPPDPNYWDPL